MNERKKLKKQLGDKYIFKMYLSVNDVKKLLSENPRISTTLSLLHLQSAV